MMSGIQLLLQSIDTYTRYGLRWRHPALIRTLCMYRCGCGLQGCVLDGQMSSGKGMLDVIAYIAIVLSEVSASAGRLLGHVMFKSCNAVELLGIIELVLLQGTCEMLWMPLHPRMSLERLQVSKIGGTYAGVLLSAVNKTNKQKFKVWLHQGS